MWWPWWRSGTKRRSIAGRMMESSGWMSSFRIRWWSCSFSPAVWIRRRFCVPRWRAPKRKSPFFSFWIRRSMITRRSSRSTRWWWNSRSVPTVNGWGSSSDSSRGRCCCSKRGPPRWSWKPAASSCASPGKPNHCRGPSRQKSRKPSSRWPSSPSGRWASPLRKSQREAIWPRRIRRECMRSRSPDSLCFVCWGSRISSGGKCRMRWRTARRLGSKCGWSPAITR